MRCSFALPSFGRVVERRPQFHIKLDPLPLNFFAAIPVAMNQNRFSLLLLLLPLCLRLLAEEVLCITRSDFPKDFVFGAGTSAYQYEGAVDLDGRTPNIWDTLTHEGRILDKSTGDIASDGYHKYKEDAKLMSDVGIEAYRLSISWSRILPKGRGVVNPKGLIYYKNVINEIFKRGIKLHISLNHLDLPQILQDEYGGWLSPKVVDDFKEYADVCFREFGDKVSHWTTIVEPNIFGEAGYDNGFFAPARCSYPFGFNCSAGNSTTEPYIAVHNMLLAHANVVNLYRSKYQGNQNGQIGLNFYSFWCYPTSNSSADIEAVQRVFDFQFGWVLNPIVFGDYPKIMKKNARSKLPNFTTAQSNLLKGSYDFIGINHYSSAFVNDYSAILNVPLRDLFSDMAVHIGMSRNYTPSTGFDPTHLVVDPAGLQNMLEYLKLNYGDPPIYVEENGQCFGDNISAQLNDTTRVDYLKQYIGATLEAIRNGVNVKGYFVWSFIDLYEFLGGYKSACGLYHVDFEDERRPRTPKLSAYWYRNFLKNNNEAFGIMDDGSNLHDLLHLSQ